MIGDMSTQTTKIIVLVIIYAYLLDFETINLITCFFKITSSGREALSYLYHMHLNVNKTRITFPSLFRLL